MKLLKKLREIADGHREALERNEQTRAAAEEQAKHLPRESQVADALVRITAEQAKTLTAHNDRNHYSESLTHSLRGRTA